MLPSKKFKSIKIFVSHPLYFFSLFSLFSLLSLSSFLSSFLPSFIPPSLLPSTSSSLPLSSPSSAPLFSPLHPPIYFYHSLSHYPLPSSSLLTSLSYLTHCSLSSSPLLFYLPFPFLHPLLFTLSYLLHDSPPLPLLLYPSLHPPSSFLHLSSLSYHLHFSLTPSSSLLSTLSYLPHHSLPHSLPCDTALIAPGVW